MTQKILNPFSGDTIEEISTATEADVHDAIGRASAIRGELAAMPAHQRGAVLNRTAEIIEAQQTDLADIMVKESGKPLRYAKGEVARAVETFTFAADAARNIHGETIPMDAARGGVGKMGYYVRVPVGVVAAITPFNFPLNLVAHKIAPAVAAGCPLVLKPAPATPLTALRLADIMQEAGLPADAFQVVVGDADVGRWLTTDDRVSMITFTGSLGVARKISEVAGIRRTTFELGGNAATVIDGDADIDKLLDRVTVGSFAYSGQVCISVQRLYVHRSQYDTFKEKFVNRVEDLTLGDPAQQETEIGPMINETAAERVAAWLQEAEKKGATILSGGSRSGAMFEPTIIENVTSDMKIMCDEVFGPVVNLIPFDDFDTVLNEVNHSEYGLQAGVYTNNLTHVMLAVNKLDVGGVMINDVPTFRVDHMPYGGNKNSGVGREGPRFAIEDYTTLKMVVLNPS